VQSVPITTKVVSSLRGVLIQHYVINLSVTCGWSVIFTGYSTIASDRHNITELLLNVALSIINHPSNPLFYNKVEYIFAFSVEYTNDCFMYG